MEKLKRIIKAVVVLSYIFLIGAMVVNNDNFIFKEEWLLILNIILLGIGLYYFVTYSDRK